MVRQFYRRFRTTVLSIVLSAVGVATGTATANAILQDATVLGPATMAAGVLLAAVICIAQTRHAPLAILAAIAPLPGLILAAPVSGGPAFGFVPFLAYAFGFAVAALQAETVTAKVLDDAKHEYAWLPAAAAVGLMTALAALWFWRTHSADAAVQATVDVFGATLSAALLVPAGGSLLHFDENFVARANRVREWRHRICERLTFVTVPRWALSLTGVTFVFLALGWFGAEPLIGVLRSQTVLRIAISVLVFAVVAERVAGGWREAIAVTLVAAVAALTALWGMALARRGTFYYPGALEVAAFAALIAFCGARRAAEFRRGGDDPAEARTRAMEEGSGLLFAAAGAIASMTPGLFFLQPNYAVYPVAMLFAALGGAVLAPAITAAVEVLLHRRHSVEELYGRR